MPKIDKTKNNASLTQGEKKKIKQENKVGWSFCWPVAKSL